MIRATEAWSARLPGMRRVVAPVGLVDVAPTLLRMMGLPQPPEMTGRPLVEPA